MKLIDIINDEKRNKDNFLTIKLRKEGTFWRAYEWSAYLSEFLANDFRDEDKLKPTHNPLKGTQNGYIFVGVPTNSLKKYFPNVPDSILLKNDDSIKEFQIENKSNMKFEDAEPLLNEVPLKTYKSANNTFKYKSNNTNTTIKYSSDEVIKLLVNFQVERNTPIDCLNFISDLKTKMNN